MVKSTFFFYFRLISILIMYIIKYILFLLRGGPQCAEVSVFSVEKMSMIYFELPGVGMSIKLSILP